MKPMGDANGRGRLETLLDRVLSTIGSQMVFFHNSLLDSILTTKLDFFHNNCGLNSRLKLLVILVLFEDLLFFCHFSKERQAPLHLDLRDR